MINFDRNWEGNFDWCPNLLCQTAPDGKETWYEIGVVECDSNCGIR